MGRHRFQETGPSVEEDPHSDENDLRAILKKRVRGSGEERVGVGEMLILSPDARLSPWAMRSDNLVSLKQRLVAVVTFPGYYNQPHGLVLAEAGERPHIGHFWLLTEMTRGEKFADIVRVITTSPVVIEDQKRGWRTTFGYTDRDALGDPASTIYVMHEALEGARRRPVGGVTILSGADWELTEPVIPSETWATSPGYAIELAIPAGRLALES